MADRLFLRLEDDPLYAPETTVPAGTLREFAPAPLQDRVANVVAYEEVLAAGTAVTEGVLPDGALRLIVDLKADWPRWAELAVDAGFYDQAHLINEFRSLCGLTPEAFVQQSVSRCSSTAR